MTPPAFTFAIRSFGPSPSAFSVSVRVISSGVGRLCLAFPRLAPKLITVNLALGYKPWIYGTVLGEFDDNRNNRWRSPGSDKR